MSRLTILIGTVLVYSAALAEGPAPSFTRKPAATKDGANVRITFAVDRETDVTVTIEDAKGKPVRHLVAGRLGTNAPPPLTRGSLDQAIVWDGKDDRGVPVLNPGIRNPESGTRSPDPSFRVRVGLGTKPVLQELIGYEPSSLGPIRAMAVGPNGDLFVFHIFGQIHPDDNGAAICVFNRAGKYVKTIMPYPADLPDEKLKGLKRLVLADGRKVPFICQIETRSYLPGLGNLPKQRAVVTRDGRLAFMGVLEGPRPFANPGECRLVTIGTDGSVPVAPLGATLAWASDSGASLALSPDDRTLYAAGLRISTHQSTPGNKTICEKCDGAGHGNTWECTKPSHAVYALGWDAKKPRVFAGDPDKPGTGPDQLAVPVSVAVGAEGNVYVADRANDRIAVFGPDGKPLAQIKIGKPLRVEVHRKTGAIYVLVGRDGADVELVKIDRRAGDKEVCRTVAAKSLSFQPTRYPLLALDDTAEPPLLYTSPLLRIEDRGDRFSEPVSLMPGADKAAPHGIGSVMELGLDRARDCLYINSYWRYKVADRAWESIASPKGARDWRPMWPMHTTYSSTGSVGVDGKYYSFIGYMGGRVYRFDADLNLLPFPAAAVTKSTVGDAGHPIVGTGHGHGNGHTADAAGNVYVIWNKSRSDPADYHQSQALSSYGPDGVITKNRLIDTSFPNIFSPRIDAAGNIYVAVGLRPGTNALPPELQARLPAGHDDPDAVNGLNGYPLIYGSIAKFSPAGGRIRDGIGGVVCNYGHGRRIEVAGAEWIFPGASTVTSWATPKGATGTVTICLCESACFDVDEFGRSFFADAGRCRVGMIDTAGNEIGWFGSYGNQDDGMRNAERGVRSEERGMRNAERGVRSAEDTEFHASASPSPTPHSALRTPRSEIPLAWPQAIAAGNGFVYVGDRVNRRVVRVRLDYAAVETATVDN